MASISFFVTLIAMIMVVIALVIGYKNSADNANAYYITAGLGLTLMIIGSVACFSSSSSLS